jgi:hypothetical protein
MNKKIWCTCVAALALAGTIEARAADMAPPPDTSDWTFNAALYLWAAGLSGDAGVFGLPPQEIDLSFGDVIQNLDMAFMGAGELRNGPFSVGMDLMYTKLGASVDTPFGIAATSIDVTAKNFAGTLVAGYALVDTGEMHLDAIAGARLWYANTDFDFNGGALGGTSADDGDTWVDPLVGAKFRADLGSNFYFSGWGMVGGFGVSSDIMWDVLGGVGYEFSDSISTFVGYRALGVDYSKDGFVYDVTQQGPIIAGVFRF